MRRIAAVLSLVVLLPLAPAPARADVVVSGVGFVVTNPLDGAVHSIFGSIYRPASSPRCLSSVLVLVHGLSYGLHAWDFTFKPGYSVARALAERGYPTVAFSLPGYTKVNRPNGRTLTVQSYAAMMSQVSEALRAQGFGRVGLMGHSAGTEISELTAAIFGNVDALIATGYTHFPSQRIVQDFVTGDSVRAIPNDYEYFGENEAQRSEYMYNLAVADPEIVAEDNRLANLTPSGEVHTIGMQPSGKVMQKITAPTLLVLAEKDLLFPVENGDQELLLFASATDRSKLVVPAAGHSFMLHPNAADANDGVADWLDARPAAMPRC